MPYSGSLLTIYLIHSGVDMLQCLICITKLFMNISILWGSKQNEGEAIKKGRREAEFSLGHQEAGSTAQLLVAHHLIALYSPGAPWKAARPGLNLKIPHEM